MNIDSRVSNVIGEAIEWRRDIHEHPELGYDVQRTAGFVAEKLRSFGVDEVVEGVGRTGVVGVIKGRHNDSGRTIGMRADMDALPIVEATGLDYASSTPGLMHACGHDGHTAMLLAAARVLSGSRSFNGTVVVIFQPAEESGAGGKAMVEDGLMERFGIQQVFGMHNLPTLPVGEFGLCTGPIMAAADTIDIEIEGRGGHAAMPHLSVDTVVVASQVVVALQHIAARQIDPLRSVVVSVPTLKTDGDSYNVLPQKVHMKGTVRTLDAAVQDEAERSLHRLITDTASAYGATAKISYIRDYPATVNTASEVDLAAVAAAAVAGEAQVNRNITPLMAGEDFSFMLNARPGAFVFTGNGDSASLHHPAYNFNDDALAYGSNFWLQLAETAMPV